MTIALFDYRVVPANPSGSCNRAIVSALAEEHDFVVFASQFDNPAPSRVRWVRVPAMLRPLALLYLTFHVAAALRYLQFSLFHPPFALTQSVESNFGFGTLVYAHFCHRWFLKNRWQSCRTRGIRGFFRWIDHALHAAVEPITMKRAKWIVVPSHGLAAELAAEYPYAAHKLHLIPNPVDLSAFGKPFDFDRAAWRAKLEVTAEERLLVFVALGHFERKGLPLLLDALVQCSGLGLRLTVVGGKPDLIREYRGRVSALNLDATVAFTGHQADVRPYLWAADLFVLPSHYEVFPLAALQAAAARCPILATKLNGLEEFLGPANSLVTEPRADSIAASLHEFSRMPQRRLAEISEAAAVAVSSYGVDQFANSWRTLYQTMDLK